MDVVYLLIGAGFFALAAALVERVFARIKP